MNFKVINNKKFIIKINNSYKELNIDNQNTIIKDILILIKKRYAYNVYGYYEVNIYNIKDLITILIFNKLNSDDYYKTIDLKIINHNKNIKIEYDDYELKSTKNIFKKCEHYSIKNLNLQY